MSRTNYRVDVYDRITARLRAQSHAPLRTRCAWCQQLIHDGVLTRDGHESHGICPACSKKHFPTDAA